MRKIILLLSSLITVTNCSLASTRLNSSDVSTNDNSKKAFSHALKNLNNDELDKFILGKSFFRVPWVEAPAATTARDGLGPLFSSNTCINCHPRNGAGVAVDNKGELTRSLILRLSTHGENEPTYGTQLSLNGTFDVPYEGKPQVSYKEILNTYPDGAIYNLRKPTYTIIDLQYGALQKNTVIAPRIGLALIGLGLIERIPESAILANSDEQDKNKDGISGRTNYVYSLEKKKNMLGRFTWKASAPTVKQQVAAAFNNDMGLTSHLFPNENCTDKQKECLNAPKGRGNKFDVSKARLDAVTYYVSSLKIPTQRNSKKYVNGAKIFKQISCSKCHIPSFITADNLTIHPFSDFLLHDMGKDLSDGKLELNANEWRTPPLWGIGLYKKVSGEANYLHDGRARSIEEAILWHGGEAKKSKEKFMNLKKEDRQELISFMRSI